MKIRDMSVLQLQAAVAGDYQNLGAENQEHILFSLLKDNTATDLALAIPEILPELYRKFSGDILEEYRQRCQYELDRREEENE